MPTKIIKCVPAVSGHRQNRITLARQKFFPPHEPIRSRFAFLGVVTEVESAPDVPPATSKQTSGKTP
jgi:hypothetical protein